MRMKALSGDINKLIPIKIIRRNKRLSIEAFFLSLTLPKLWDVQTGHSPRFVIILL